MIQLEDLTYSYPATDQPALRDLTLQVESGEFVAVVGPNGAGKSTLCYALSGFIPHFFNGVLSGQLNVAGQDLHQVSSSELAGTVGLVFQDPFNQISGARFTVQEEIAFGLENLGAPRESMPDRINQAMSIMGLEELADRSPFELSGGQQQRLALATVLVMEPSLLILDEPTSQLDPVGTKEVFQALRNLTDSSETTIVLVEHKLEWVATFADRVIALDHGRIATQGKPEQVLTSDVARDIGVGETRYTRAARLTIERGWMTAGEPLPVNLQQAKQYFT